ncbi:hypothetical protein LPW26_15465 [Rhodopseudomonas sp. HC1]|uniref:hypothetical protein n=1 Tax=Rhodopseudomonas infernalis TaxID=2897386 RepID=UPI001EE842D2|nr:hypothetical protein [Rhodopseudomonas infernalis]MCG6206048.1 hypothetical protein [Rhodopseudomonas infernalis]
MSAAGRQWLWPIALAAATLFGLLSALAGDHGIWRGLCWIALALPLLTIAWCASAARRR